MKASILLGVFQIVLLFACGTSLLPPHRPSYRDPYVNNPYTHQRRYTEPTQEELGPASNQWGSYDISEMARNYPPEFTQWLAQIFNYQGKDQSWWRGYKHFTRMGYMSRGHKMNLLDLKEQTSTLFALIRGIRPNVCLETTEREEVGDSSTGYLITNCDESEEHYTCTTRKRMLDERGQWIERSTTRSYRCCHGFVRKPGQHGCQESNVQGMMATLKEIGAFKFVNLLNDEGLSEIAESPNMTLFCPIDSAINDAAIDEHRGNEVPLKDQARRVDKKILLGHMVPNIVNAVDFIDEQIMNTENADAPLRTNIFQDYNHQNLVTVNCARVLAVNVFTKNGIVHTVDRLIVPATKSVADIIISDPQFTIMKAVLSHSGLLKTLRQPGQFTVFAPTDDAFRRLDPNFVYGLRHGQGCPSSFVKNHVIPNVICASAIQEGLSAVKNMLEKIVFIHRTDDKIFIKDGNLDAQIVAKDIMGTNGVVHILDAAIQPEESANIATALEEKNLTAFIDALEFSDMITSMETLKNATVFAPSNEAFEKLPSEKQKWLRDSPERMRDLLQYHVVESKMASCDFEDNLIVPTKQSGKSIRINIYDMFMHAGQQFTAQCATISSRDGKACESTIQVIDRVMLPPEGDINRILAVNGSFGILRRLLRDADLEDLLSQPKPPHTLFAPPDSAFYALPEEDLKRYLTDKELAKKLISNHIIEGHLCCAGIHKVPWYIKAKLPTLGGKLVEVNRHLLQDLVTIENIRISNCDMVADNGVVHTVDKVIIPHDMNYVSRHRHRQPDRQPQRQPTNINPYDIDFRDIAIY